MAKIKREKGAGKKFSQPLINYGFKLAKKFLKRAWLRYLFILFLFIIVVILLLFKPRVPNDPLLKEFGEVKTKLVKNPTNPELHLNLAQIYKEVNNFQKSKEEILIALQYSPNSRVLQKSLEEIKKLEEKPQEIKKEIAKWEGVVLLYPNFRDAWFRLSVLYWQVFEEEKAKTALGKTLELDPNFVPAQKFKSLLN